MSDIVIYRKNNKNVAEARTAAEQQDKQNRHYQELDQSRSFLLARHHRVRALQAGAAANKMVRRNRPAPVPREPASGGGDGRHPDRFRRHLFPCRA